MILRAAESDHIDRAGEDLVGVRTGIMKRQTNGMIVFLVFVDYHERPLAIRPLHGISSHQDVPRWVNDIGRRRKQLMLSASWLHPLAD